MKILATWIRNYRNLESVDLAFSDRVNLFLGPNGQGKTNLLEALNYVALGRSHRGARNEDLIRLDGDNLYVRLEADLNDGQRAVFEYGFSRAGRRLLRLDGQALKRRSELVGQLNTVFFSPGSVYLVRGRPEKRRRFVDQGIATIDRLYLADLQAYQRALRQKAHLLREIKRGAEDRQEARREIVAWNRELAATAAGICLGRAVYGGRIGPAAARRNGELTGQDQALEFIYRPRLKTVSGEAKREEIEKDFLAEFDYIIEDEIHRGRPLSGPQMDDFEVRLGGLDLRTYGSQGETRTAAVSLILAQSDVVYQVRHVRPVLFFDDIFSELDRQRARRLQETTIREHQVFIATARNDDVAGWQPPGLRTWGLNSGKLESLA